MSAGKKRTKKTWSLPIENVPGLVLRANATGGSTLPMETVKIDPERRIIYGFVHVKHDGGSPTIEQLKALDRAARRGILGLPPAIDKRRLAERVLQDRPLRQHEKRFVAGLILGKKRRAARPRSTDVALKRDEIAQDVLYAQALHPDWRLQSIIKRIQKLHKVSRGFVFKVLRETDPGRRSAIGASAKAFAEWQAEVAARATTKRKK